MSLFRVFVIHYRFLLLDYNSRDYEPHHDTLVLFLHLAKHIHDMRNENLLLYIRNNRLYTNLADMVPYEIPLHIPQIVA